MKYTAIIKLQSTGSSTANRPAWCSVSWNPVNCCMNTARKVMC